jgi:hypothetical protein
MMNVTITKEENKPSGRLEREHGLFPSLAFFCLPLSSCLLVSLVKFDCLAIRRMGR